MAAKKREVDENGHLKCARCLERFPVPHFGVRSDSGRPKPYCRRCINAMSREHTEKHSKGKTKRYCAGCKKWLLNCEFQQMAGGRQHKQCKPCVIREVRSGSKKQSVILDGQKLCLDCFELIALSEFWVTPRGLGGLAAYCKPCLKAKAQQVREIYH